MNKPSDQYAFWRRTLAGHKVPMHEGDIESGFYRRREKNGVDGAVAYWRDEHDQQHCALNGKPMQLDRAIELWTHVCARPVSHADYEHRMKEGHWPNELPEQIGHNQPPEDTSRDGIFAALDAIEAEAITIINRGPATTQGAADKASKKADQLAEISKRIVAIHRTEKAPVIAEGKRIDQVWFPLRDRADDLKSKLKLRVVTPFLSRLRRDQEAALEAAQAAGADTTGLEKKVSAAGLHRTTALKTVKTARIEDYHATLAFFANNQEVRELVQRLADRAARTGVSVPGCAVIETEQAV